MSQPLGLRAVERTDIVAGNQQTDLQRNQRNPELVSCEATTYAEACCFWHIQALH